MRELVSNSGGPGPAAIAWPAAGWSGLGVLIHSRWRPLLRRPARQCAQGGQVRHPQV